MSAGSAEKDQSQKKASFFSWLPSFARPARASATAQPGGEDKKESSAQDPAATASQKKAALDCLDEEIKSLNEKVTKEKAKKAPSKLDSMAAKQMEALGKMASGASKDKKADKGKKPSGWEEMDSGSGAGLSGDLDFNDLEIQFDDSK